jgi:cytochrome c-type biogenesis protein CcmH/NrfG
LGRAEDQFRRTDYAAAIGTLLALSPKSAAAYSLLGRTYYMAGQYKNAITYLEKAVTEDPRNSNYRDWLGRAYGRRAEESGFMAALGYAKKTHAAFEQAVALDPANLEALSDLFEYLLQAPGIVGGGTDKAALIAERIGGVSQAEYHYSCARLAEKRRDLRAAEQELRKALAASPGDVGRAIDLARFLAEHGRIQESDAVFHAAEQIAPDSPKLLFARAAAYVHNGRNLEEAKLLLQRYNELPVTPDDPPRSDVAQLLQRCR